MTRPTETLLGAIVDGVGVLLTIAIFAAFCVVVVGPVVGGGQ